MTTPGDRFRTFEEFWPYYVKEHSKPLTRYFHFVGTGMALGCLATFALTRKARFIPLGLVAGYGPAWFSHFFIEKNRPATFTYPAWSLQADFKMFEMMLTGRMDAEVERVLREYEAAQQSAETTPPANGSSVAHSAESAERKTTDPLPN
ncbi:MAG: DUF962 domain-containing protein [Myxococcales bacterium]|nr:DUF962 domain-containing protein [Myxococcales bacterium]